MESSPRSCCSDGGVEGEGESGGGVEGEEEFEWDGRESGMGSEVL